MAVFAPIPSASERMATVANSGLRRSPRRARRRSDQDVMDAWTVPNPGRLPDDPQKRWLAPFAERCQPPFAFSPLAHRHVDGEAAGPAKNADRDGGPDARLGQESMQIVEVFHRHAVK